MRFGLALAVVFGVAHLAPAPACADEPTDARVRAAARELGADGMALFAKGDWAEALDRFERANKLVAAPTLQVRAARCLVKLGRLVEASERYLDATRMDLPANALPVHFQARREAQQERDQLMPTLPRLAIKLDGPGIDVSVKLDGRAVPAELIGAPQPVDPGKHEIVARRGDAEVTKTVDVRLSEHATVTLNVPIGGGLDTASEPLTPWKRAAVGTLAAGGGLLLIGAISGFAALAEHKSLEGRCPDHNCPPDAHGAVDAYDAARGFATFGLVAGAVAAATGTVLFFTEPTPSAEAPRAEGDVDDARFRAPVELELRVSAGGVALGGRF